MTCEISSTIRLKNFLEKFEETKSILAVYCSKPVDVPRDDGFHVIN